MTPHSRTPHLADVVAPLAGKRDNLTGLKENVIVGHMVPAGTGFKEYQKMELFREEPPASESEEETITVA